MSFTHDELTRMASGAWPSTNRDLARELLKTRAELDWWRERTDVAERLVDALDSGEGIDEARADFDEMHEAEPIVPPGALDFRGRP